MTKEEILKKYSKKENNDVKVKIMNKIKSFALRSLAVASLFLILATICKYNNDYHDIIYKKIYLDNFSFTQVKQFYSKYLGGVSFLDKYVLDTKPVFNENLTYYEKSRYYDGVKLKVDNNYLIPSIESGIVVFKGEKEHYGNVVIIQGMDGVDIWYGNISTSNINLYDYIEEGSFIGETIDETLYLVYSKGGNILNYEEYLN